MGWVILGLIAFIVITVLVAMPDYMKEKEVILKSQQLQSPNQNVPKLKSKCSLLH